MPESGPAASKVISDPTRGKRKRELHKLAVARSDIAAALHAAELVVNRVQGLGDDLYMPLFHAAAIAYGRPFTHNRPYGALGGKWERFTDPRLQQTHDTLIRVRDELVAHSDQSRRTVDIIPGGTPLGEGRAAGRLMLSVATSVFPLQRFQDVAATCADLSSRLNEAVESLLRALFAGQPLPATEFPLTFDDD